MRCARMVRHGGAVVNPERIVWKDHVGRPGTSVWITAAELADLPGAALFISAGFVVREDDESVWVSSTISSDETRDAMGEPELILKVCIVSRHPLVTVRPGGMLVTGSWDVA